MKVLLTGAEGQLGRELRSLLPQRGHEALPFSRKDLDVTDPAAVDAAVREHEPQLVVNAAAYTDVDGCEAETELAYAVNALGPRNLATSCERSGCDLLHVSTNYVFDGRQDRPYEPFDPPSPTSAYGRSKLAGEEYVKHLSSRWYVVRTAAVYGDGRNFVRTMLRVGAEGGRLRVKDDEYVSPTGAWDLAGAVVGISESGLYGIYHATNSGSCSWYEFAEEIFALGDTEVEVVPVPSSDYPLPADRPANGVLSSLGGPEMRPWREALAEYLQREKTARSRG